MGSGSTKSKSPEVGPGRQEFVKLARGFKCAAPSRATALVGRVPEQVHAFLECKLVSEVEPQSKGDENHVLFNSL